MKIPNQQGGFVLIVAVMMLVIITTMGLGLLKYTEYEIEKVSQLESSVDLMNTAENCIVEAANLLEQTGKTMPPCENGAALKACLNVSNKMTKWNRSSDSNKLKNKSTDLDYKCAIKPLSRETADGGGAGYEVGQQNVYGQATTNTKYLYLIEAEASESGQTNKVKVDVVASMVY
jgi:Tfp pilus assembly protein PilX